jgi:hypothetical protein
MQMLQDEVQVSNQLTNDDEVWDDMGNRVVTWSLSFAIAGLLAISFLINFFLI